MPRGAPYRAQCRQYPIWLIHCSTFLSSDTADAQSHMQTQGGTVAASAFQRAAIADTDPRNYVHDPLRSLLNIAVGQSTKLIAGDSDVPRCRNQGRVKPALRAAAPAVRPAAYSSARRRLTAARGGPALSSAPTAASRTDRRRQR